MEDNIQIYESADDILMAGGIETVRCRDCIHSHISGGKCGDGYYMYCDFFDEYVISDSFCSCGEKRG